MSRKVTVMLDDDAADLLLTLSGTPRKQGEYLSALIRGEASRVKGFAELPAEVGQLRQDLTRLEQQVLAIQHEAQNSSSKAAIDGLESNTAPEKAQG